MPAPVPPPTQQRYLHLRQQGWSRAAAIRECGVSESWAIKFDKGHENSGDGYRSVREQKNIKDPIPFDKLCDEAQRALDDFEFFRRRYMGHISTHWQVDTAYLLRELKESGEREYVVENVAPGLGKSTLLVDIAAWFTVRDRAIRGLFISRAQSLAERNVMRLRRYLDRVVPVRAKPDDIAKGLAVDADATLAGDYGRFKPVTAGDVWKKDEFVVVQMDGSPIEEKEPTWSAFGFDSEWIGNRFNLSFADDLDSTRSTRSVDVVARNQETFDNELEPRLEPGGLMVVCQQRLGPHDFSSHCLAKRIVPDDDGTGEDVEGDVQYRHIVYKTHYLELCQGKNTHRSDSTPWNGTQDGGCLLDPRRLGWRDVRKAMNNRTRFEVVYQQEDVDPASVLVQKLWVTGGRGPDGVDHPGCWDPDRGVAELPAGILQRETLSVVSCDPSPSKFWAIEWWIWDPQSDFRFLMDLARQKMEAPDFLYSAKPNEYSGLLEEWWHRSSDLGKPFTHVIIELNSAERFMYQQPYFFDWGRTRSVNFVKHTTHRNKADPDYGIQMVAPHWQYGRVRLPGKRDNPGRIAAMKLVDEVTRYPESGSDDCLMAEWFFEHQLPNIWVPPTTRAVQQDRPSWSTGLASWLKRSA